MLTILVTVFVGGWILLRGFSSVLDVPERKLIAKYRLYGLACGAPISLLMEMMVGRYLVKWDPAIEAIMGPMVCILVVTYGEWCGERELRKRGVKTAGVFSSKLY